MARKITMNASSYKSVAEVFGDFVISQTAQGLSSVTLTNYRHHFHSISRHLDTSQSMDTLTKSKLEAMVVSMRQSGLAHNSISSYCRVLRTFLGWCEREGMTVPPMPHIKDKETVKESYTDEELEAILKRPKRNHPGRMQRSQSCLNTPPTYQSFCWRVGLLHLLLSTCWPSPRMVAWQTQGSKIDSNTVF